MFLLDLQMFVYWIFVRHLPVETGCSKDWPPLGVVAYFTKFRQHKALLLRKSSNLSPLFVDRPLSISASVAFAKKASPLPSELGNSQVNR